MPFWGLKCQIFEKSFKIKLKDKTFYYILFNFGVNAIKFELARVFSVFFNPRKIKIFEVSFRQLFHFLAFTNPNFEKVYKINVYN